MSLNQVSPFGELRVTVPASQKIAVYSLDRVQVYKDVGFPNVPATQSLDFTSAAGVQTISGAYTNATTLRIRAGAAPVQYAVGASPNLASGAASVTGSVPSSGNVAGGASAIAGGAGSGTGAGGAATVTGGASGAGATGNGGSATVAGGAAASTNGNGGDVTLTPGLLSGTGVNGIIRANGVVERKLSRNTIANAGTVTVAQVAAGVLFQDASSGAVTMTSPTASAIDAAFPTLGTGDSLDLYVASNHATNTSTISGGSGVTLVGSGAMTNLGGHFKLIRTGAAAYDLVRIG